MEIRPVTIGDAEAIAEIRRQDGVRESVLGLSSERVAVTEDFLRSFGERDRGFVAVENGETVGFAVMLANREECRAHSGFIAVMVDSGRQQRGIGEKLLSRITDCADNELSLHRLELLVLTDNEQAIKLYKRHGFEVEATKHHAAVVRGRFADEYLMGRLREKEAAK
ncbi:GNAT family N-acetyltransferase [uncultured Cloacibacillus sp.]|uniref:GNAT family N-acetyltransferase n=1 Tax=uncultured Cloacibacillus sp. TaxID=889794 RepID=UPI0026DC6D46|nr:GNAT family N-acetyltransferase [uncultured Cloacibacillus sp.]